jgi:hypothetical protein
LVPGSRFDADHPENGVLIPCRFTVQDELTHEIVAALKVKLTVGAENRIGRKRTVNVEAYELFLRGREQAWTHTRAGLIAARGLAGAAIALDSRYAAARALIAFTHLVDYANGWSEDSDQSLCIARTMAEQAVGMAADQPDGHFALGPAYLFSRDSNWHSRRLNRASLFRRAPWTS